MSTNLEIEKEKGRGKEKVGDRSAKLNEKKERQRPSTRDKKQRRHSLLEEQRENFVAAARKWKILAAPLTRKFLEVSRCSAKQRQRKCAARADLIFAN